MSFIKSYITDKAWNKASKDLYTGIISPINCMTVDMSSHSDSFFFLLKNMGVNSFKSLKPHQSYYSEKVKIFKNAKYGPKTYLDYYNSLLLD